MKMTTHILVVYSWHCDGPGCIHAITGRSEWDLRRRATEAGWIVSGGGTGDSLNEYDREKHLCPECSKKK